MKLISSFFIVVVGLGQEPKHSDVVTLNEEKEMLALEAASPSTPGGLNCRLLWYYTNRFFSRGASELQAMDSTQFQLILDEFNKECLR